LVFVAALITLELTKKSSNSVAPANSLGNSALTVLISGAVKMVHDNGEQEYKAPHLIVTPKGVKHQFTALEENTVFCCVHAIRDGDGVDDVASPDITSEKAFELMTTYSLTT